MRPLNGIYVCGALLCVALAPACEREPAGTATLVASKAIAQTAAPRLVWDTAQAHRYRLELSSSSSLQGAPAPMAFTLKGELIASFEPTKEGYLALMRLESPTLLGADGQRAREGQSLENGLSATFVVEYQQGRLTRYWDTKGQPSLLHGLRRSLAAALQFSPPPTDLGGKSWTGDEWDGTGRSRVEYTLASSDEVSVKRLGYEELLIETPVKSEGLETAKLTPRIEDSSGRLGLDGQGLVRVVRSDRLAVPLTKGATLFSGCSLELLRIGFGSRPAREAWEAAKSAGVLRTVQQPVPVDNQRALDAARVGERTYDQVLTELEHFAKAEPGKEPDAQTRGRVFHALVGLFRMDPANVARAERTIASSKDSGVRTTLLDALAASSSVEAVAALRRVALAAKLPGAERLRAASAFVRLPTPGPEAVAVLEEMLETPALWEHGILGLGTFTRKLREQGQSRLEEKGTRILRQELEGAKDDKKRATVLLAIANSGSPELYEPVLPYQKSADRGVQDAAIQAVRLMARPEVEGNLVALLTPKRPTRLSALRALSRREATQRSTLDAVKVLAEKDEDAEVRREAVLALVAWEKRWPELGMILETIAKDDAQARVREVATRSKIR